MQSLIVRPVYITQNMLMALDKIDCCAKNYFSLTGYFVFIYTVICLTCESRQCQSSVVDRQKQCYKKYMQNWAAIPSLQETELALIVFLQHYILQIKRDLVTQS